MVLLARPKEIFTSISMDAYQQPNRFTRPPPPPPPPPSTADPPPHYHHQQQQQPLRQPGPLWLSNQFQYHPSHSQSPPLPQWDPPPPPQNFSHQSQFPPPPPPRPYLPHPHAHSQVPPQGYSQEWGNPNWGHHQAYQVHKNEEDWAERAKAWATAKTAMDTQPPQSQFTPVTRPEEQVRYNDQYPQTVDSHYPETVAHSIPSSSYQPYSNRPPVGHFQESASVSPGPFSYAPDGHNAHYTGRNGSVAGDPNTAFSHQEALQSPSVHQQEVPSSYSSVTGREHYADRNEHSYTSMHFPASFAQEVQHSVQSNLANQPYPYGSQSANLQPGLSDQPLEFAPRFNSDHDPHAHANYSHSDVGGSARGVDPVATMPSAHSWPPPVAPSYLPIPPALPSGPQHDPSMHSPVPVHTVPPFSGFPGPGFQPSVPSAGTPYRLGAGNALHPATSFPGDAYGISGVSERPKKAPVPNWLRDEIIKKKTAMTSSSQEHLKEETPSIDDEVIDRSSGKGDQGDSRSIESSRSTEEENDDEDYVEAARTAAINSEIKRILTEVLLKVTDELFDEIAAKVISEDDQTKVDVDHKTGRLNEKVSVSPSPPIVLTSKASAKVLIPIPAKETNFETSGKSNSSSPGDVLGLGNYASDEDDEEDDEIESSAKSKSRSISVMQSGTENNSADTRDVTENENSQVEKDERGKNAEGASNGTSNNHSIVNAGVDARGLRNGNVDSRRSSEISGGKDNKNNIDGQMLHGTNGVGEEVIMKSEQSRGNIDVKGVRDDPPGKETRIKLDKNDLHDSKRSSSGKDFKATDSSKIRSDEKGDEKRRRQDDKHTRKDQVDDRHVSKHRAKEQVTKIEEKAKESESRKRSTQLSVKEERKEKERPQRISGKEDVNKKRERAKDEKDRSQQTLESNKHKRRRSSSDSSRGKTSQDSPADRTIQDSPADRTNDSSDEASDDSRRKLHSRRRDLSPSPVRSRRRQVSRSPHSKHSQRRHSPYSSFETTRRRRSRSKSPVRRQR